jgi:ABC-type spermidine/putrescine transport system permease subunit II
MWRKVLGGWVGVTLLFLYLPITVVVVYAFNANEGNVSVWTGFTTQWFASVFQNSSAQQAIATSAQIAAVNALFAMVLGTLGALAIRGAPRRVRVGFDVLAYLTLVTPVVVLGIATLISFVIAGIARGSLTILLVHVVFNSSIVFLVVRSRIIGLSVSEEEAAMDLGAHRFWTTMRVTIPRLRPAIVAGGLLAFTYSWDDYIIASFVSGAQTKTLPMYIFSQLRFGVSPEVNVLATMTLIVTIIGVAIALVILRNTFRTADDALKQQAEHSDVMRRVSP